MTVQDKTYLEQLDKYYKKELKSYLTIELGITPDILTQFGASKLPLVMLQSTLTKCTRKVTGSRSAHELPRNIIETLPEQIKNPIFIIQERARKSIAVISNATDKNGNKILIAIRLNSTQGRNQINEVKSIYGKTNLKEYLQKHIDEGQLSIADSKKAEILSRVIGLQLPKALINSSYDKRIAPQSRKVNKERTQIPAFQEKNKPSVHKKLENFQKELNQNSRKEPKPAQKTETIRT